MEYSIMAEGNLIRARAWNRQTREAPSHVCAAIFAESKRLGLTRIMVEVTQKDALPGSSQYHLVDRLTALGVTPHYRIAVVHHIPGMVQANSMIDLVAGNRGLNVKNFADVDSALAWLR
jgi:hypothetical protein